MLLLLDFSDLLLVFLVGGGEAMVRAARAAKAPSTAMCRMNTILFLSVCLLACLPSQWHRTRVCERRDEKRCQRST